MAATSLAGLLRDRGLRDEARALLQLVYEMTSQVAVAPRAVGSAISIWNCVERL